MSQPGDVHIRGGADPRRDAPLCDGRGHQYARSDNAGLDARSLRAQPLDLRPARLFRAQAAQRQMGVRSRFHPGRNRGELRGEPGRAEDHVQAAQGRQVPRRGAGHGRGRQVVARSRGDRQLARQGAIADRLADEPRSVQGDRRVHVRGDVAQARQAGAAEPRDRLPHHHQFQARQVEGHRGRPLGAAMDEGEHGGLRRLHRRDLQGGRAGHRQAQRGLDARSERPAGPLQAHHPAERS